MGHSVGVDTKHRRVDYYSTLSGKQPAREWLLGVKDVLTQAVLFKRIRQAGKGNFGKTRHVGDGVSELKINFGPGYRIYYGIYRDELILILMGGNKSTQQKDIRKARAYWLEWKEDNK